MTGGNAAKLFPDAALEGGAADIERNVRCGGAGTEAGDDGACPGADAVGILAETGAGKIVGELADELGIGFAEHDGADAARGGADEQAAERRIEDGIADFQAGSAATEITGSHAEL